MVHNKKPVFLSILATLVFLGITNTNVERTNDISQNQTNLSVNFGIQKANASYAWWNIVCFDADNGNLEYWRNFADSTSWSTAEGLCKGHFSKPGSPAFLKWINDKKTCVRRK